MKENLIYYAKFGILFLWQAYHHLWVKLKVIWKGEKNDGNIGKGQP